MQQIEDARARFRVQDQIAFLNLAAEVLEDEFLGFHLAQDCELREAGMLYYVPASSETLIEALQNVTRYTAINNEGIFQKCEGGKLIGVLYRYIGVSRHSDRHQIEFWLTALMRICRRVTGLHLVPRRVRLAHYRKDCLAEMTKFFGVPVQFGASVDEISFTTGAGRLPVVGSDPYLNKLLITQCEEAVARRPRNGGSFRSSVENAVVPFLPHGKAQLGTVAGHLGVGKRTLARRLAQEGLTFSGLLLDLRMDLANRYLAQDDLSVSQIAWLLGYQEVAAFSHAFKRWTGKTPRALRVCD